MAQRKIGVRPETHEAYGRVAELTGWTVSRTADFALAALIKAKRLAIPFDGKRAASATKDRRPTAA